MNYFKDNISEVESNKDIIPEHCLSFSEMSKFTDQANKADVSDILESIAESEVKYLKENRTPKVYTESDSEELRDRLTLHFRDRWAGYKGFWESIIESFNYTLKAMDPVANIDFSELEKDQSYGKIHEYIDYDSIKFAENAMDLYNETKKSLLENKSIPDISKKRIYGSETIVGPVVEADSYYLAKNWDNIKESLSIRNNTGKEIFGKIKDFALQESIITGLMIKEAEKVDDKFTNILSEWLPATDNILATMHECYAETLDQIYHNILEMGLVKFNVLEAATAKSIEDNSEYIRLDDEYKNGLPSPEDSAKLESFDIDLDNIE